MSQTKAIRFLIAMCVLGLLAGMTPTPEPNEQSLAPLNVVETTVNELANVPTIQEPDGKRQAGLLSMIVSRDFNTGLISEVEPNVELLREEQTALPSGERLVTLRAPDASLDAMIAALKSAVGVVSGPSKSYVRQVATNDPYWQGQVDAGLGLLDLPTLHTISQGAPSVRVAVVDTGVNKIPDLAGRVDAGRNFCGFGDPADTFDIYGHGTSVASIIAARCDNGLGICGIAPNVRIVPVKACEVNLTFNIAECQDIFVSSAVNWILTEAHAGRVDIVNMSFGGTNRKESLVPLFNALHSLDVRLVAASGNEGESPVYYPAREDHIIAVGGVNSNGTRNSYSNYGDDLWGSRESPWWNSQTGHGVPELPINALTDFGCVRYDLDGSGEIDVGDHQRLAYRAGVDYPSPLYEVKYDLQPWSYDQWPPGPGDLDIDVLDLQKTFGRDGYTCRR